jgi:hypothetical protein
VRTVDGISRLLSKMEKKELKDLKEQVNTLTGFINYIH